MKKTEKGLVTRFLWIPAVSSGMIFAIAPLNGAEKVLYDPHGRRDPFMPLVTMTSRESSDIIGIDSPEDIIIEGIVFDPKGSVVVVNGAVMKEGQEIGNLKVVKIKPTAVVFLLNNSEVSIPLYRDKERA